MKLREFLNMYDNWNGVVVINDDNLNQIVKGGPYAVLSCEDLYATEVVAFGFYDNELCVRVKGSKVKHVNRPCVGCVYFQVCGSANRTAPCEGRMTKRQRGKV